MQGSCGSWVATPYRNKHMTVMMMVALCTHTAQPLALEVIAQLIVTCQSWRHELPKALVHDGHAWPWCGHGNWHGHGLLGLKQLICLGCLSCLLI